MKQAVSGPLATNGGGLCFQLAPALSFPGAQQLVLTPHHPCALRVALNTHDTIRLGDDELIPEHRFTRLARHSLPTFGKYPSHLP